MKIDELIKIIDEIQEDFFFLYSKVIETLSLLNNEVRESKSEKSTPTNIEDLSFREKLRYKA